MFSRAIIALTNRSVILPLCIDSFFTGCSFDSFLARFCNFAFCIKLSVHVYYAITDFNYNTWKDSTIYSTFFITFLMFFHFSLCSRRHQHISITKEFLWQTSDNGEERKYQTLLEQFVNSWNSLITFKHNHMQLMFFITLKIHYFYAWFGPHLLSWSEQGKTNKCSHIIS